MQSLRGPMFGIGVSVAAALALSAGAAATVRKPVITSYCNNSSACATLNQSGTGDGARISATSGHGVNSSATSGTGVLGASSSGSGVSGSSSSATGVNGVSTSGTGVNGISGATGVSGTSTGNGSGVYGTSATGAGVFGLSPGYYGVQGVVTNPGGFFYAGAFGEVEGNPAGDSGVYGLDTTPAAVNGAYANYGVLGVSPNNVGMFGATLQNLELQNNTNTVEVEGVVGFGGPFSSLGGNPGIGVLAFGGSASDPTTGAGPAALEIQNIGGGNNAIAFNSAGAPVMSLDNSGNLILSGQIFANGVQDCTGGMNPNCPSGPNQDLKLGRSHSYAARQDVPTMETVGEGELTNGTARVPLGAYGGKIDTSKNYLVFITPQGQTQGDLYVAQKSPAGFAVRENQGGHSTVAFDYRIVGVPAHSATGSIATPRGNGRGFALPRLRLVHSHTRIHKKH